MHDDDPRERLSRDYQPVVVRSGATSVELRAGEDHVSGIRGWILLLAYRSGAVSPDHELVGTLDLRYRLKREIRYAVEGFDAGAGGVTFLPWPYAALTIRERAPSPNPTSVSEAVVSFLPILAGETAPQGIRSVLFGRSLALVRPQPAGPTEVDVPSGATEYRVTPASTLPKGKTFTIMERGAGRDWAQFTLEPDRALTSGTLVGDAAWRQVPPRPLSRIVVSHDGAGDRLLTVEWQYRVGDLR